MFCRGASVDTFRVSILTEKLRYLFFFSSSKDLTTMHKLLIVSKSAFLFIRSLNMRVDNFSAKVCLSHGTFTFFTIFANFVLPNERFPSILETGKPYFKTLVKWLDAREAILCSAKKTDTNRFPKSKKKLFNL